MRQHQAITKPGPGAAPPISLAAARAIGILAWALALGWSAVALYLAPASAVHAVVGLGLGIPLVWLVWSHPEYGLLGLVFLSSSFIRPDTFEVRLPIGGLDLRDLVLIGLLGLLIVQGAMHKRTLDMWLPVGGPLLIFLGLAVFSALYALLYREGEFNWTLGELRTLVYYAGFFLAAWAITTPRQLVVLMIGLFMLADITAMILILQQFLGTSTPLLTAMIRGSWQVWEAGAPSAAFGGVRIIPPGHVLMYILSLVAFSLMMAPGQSRRSRVLFGLQFVFLNISLLFTYTRAQWIASTVALALIIMALSWDAKRRMAGFLIKAIPVLALAYYFFGAAFQETFTNSAFFNLLENRILSIFTPAETLESFSLEWRIFENGEALRSVAEHPILGVGLGNVYREPALLHGEAADGYYRLIRYVHNSYLYLAVKMGLLGLFACIWFVLAFLAGGLRAYLRMPEGRYKQATLAILAGFIGILLWSITQSLLMQGETTLVIGLMGGLIASMRQMYAPARNEE